jgi:hypothetical protein
VPEKITISVTDDAIDRIDEVVAALEGGGMHVDQVLRPIGVITGSVEPQRTVRLPPPDSDVQ